MRCSKRLRGEGAADTGGGDGAMPGGPADTAAMAASAAGASIAVEGCWLFGVGILSEEGEGGGEGGRR